MKQLHFYMQRLIHPTRHNQKCFYLWLYTEPKVNRAASHVRVKIIGSMLTCSKAL